MKNIGSISINVWGANPRIPRFSHLICAFQVFLTCFDQKNSKFNLFHVKALWEKYREFSPRLKKISSENVVIECTNPNSPRVSHSFCIFQVCQLYFDWKNWISDLHHGRYHACNMTSHSKKWIIAKLLRIVTMPNQGTIWKCHKTWQILWWKYSQITTIATNTNFVRIKVIIFKLEKL